MFLKINLLGKGLTQGIKLGFHARRQRKRTEKRKHNRHLMTGPYGNSEFCFPETLNVPRGEAEGNIEVEGEQNSLFPEGPVIKCFVSYTSQLKIEQYTDKNYLLDVGWRTDLPPFQRCTT